MSIDFPALFDEVMAEIAFGEVTDGPHRYVFALDKAINTGEADDLRRLLKAGVCPPRACLPALAIALGNEPGQRKKRDTLLTDYDRFRIILEYQSNTADTTKVKIIKLADKYGTTKDLIRKIWEKRREQFPGLSF